MTSILGLAKQAYCAYGATTDWKNFQGNMMPKWDDLPDKIKLAWVCATSEIYLKVLQEITTPPILIASIKDNLYPSEIEEIKQRLAKSVIAQYPLARASQELTDPTPDLNVPAAP